MDSEGYQRLQRAFTALAEQSYGRHERARWLAMARASSSLAEEPPPNVRAVSEDQEKARLASLQKLAHAWAH
jgi:hypothetical protein